jgi:hypothetical protein
VSLWRGAFQTEENWKPGSWKLRAIKEAPGGEGGVRQQSASLAFGAKLAWNFHSPGGKQKPSFQRVREEAIFMVVTSDPLDLRFL